MLRVGGMREVFMTGARKAGARTGRLRWVRNKDVNNVSYDRSLCHIIALLPVELTGSSSFGVDCKWDLVDIGASPREQSGKDNTPHLPNLLASGHSGLFHFGRF